jgi:hypothetical protein
LASILDHEIREALRLAISSPSLLTARQLEETLRNGQLQRLIFGRPNQKSSIEAASESDRGIAERLSNAFDASLKAARYAVGMTETNRSLTPRIVAQRLLNPKPEECKWDPQDKRIECREPVIQFWDESEKERRRFRKYNPDDGLVTVMVGDTGIGLKRNEMVTTILDLNSPAKLKDFDAIGQFGHGGSSSLHFCESCLVITQPRFDSGDDKFYWTLIFPELEMEESKQNLIRRWFATEDGLPLVSERRDFPELAEHLPGTSIWHFGYDKGKWIRRITSPGQNNPWGRMGRLFFSYPLPFRIRGEFARDDSTTGSRQIKGAFYRMFESTDGLFDQREGAPLEYRTSEKRETLVVQNQAYGEFSVYVMVLKKREAVRAYVDNLHPVVLTLHGQNHGEMTRKVMENANLTELASRSIIEVRLDGLDPIEAQSGIITNSRERPKDTVFTRELEDRLEKLIANDEGLKAIERRLQEEKARKSSVELSKRMADFLSRILSDAVAEPSEHGGGEFPGGEGKKGEPRPEVTPSDPPRLLEFLYDQPIYVPEGTKKLAKFRSDARPPKYSFLGENPRCFARLDLSESATGRLSLAGTHDIDGRGYGAITLFCPDDMEHEITESSIVGNLIVWIQRSDGKTIEASLPVGIKPKPEERKKRASSSILPEIVFYGPVSEDLDSLASLLQEEQVMPFDQSNHLRNHCDLLKLPEIETTYWGSRTTRDGVSVLSIEINAANPRLRTLLTSCGTVQEATDAKERYVRDILPDCYQHYFKIEDMPKGVLENIDEEDLKRAVDAHLNHDKAIRIAIHERDSRRRQNN